MKYVSDLFFIDIGMFNFSISFSKIYMFRYIGLFLLSNIINIIEKIIS